MRYKIVFTKQSNIDLKSISTFISANFGDAASFAYIENIRAHTELLKEVPLSGSPRKDLGTGIRSFSLQRRLTILYMITGDRVRILRVLHKGRQLRLAPKPR